MPPTALLQTRRQTFTTLSTSLVWLSGATFHHCFFAQQFAMRSTSTRTVLQFWHSFTRGEKRVHSVQVIVRSDGQRGNQSSPKNAPLCEMQTEADNSMLCVWLRKLLNLCLCTVSPCFWPCWFCLRLLFGWLADCHVGLGTSFLKPLF